MDVFLRNKDNTERNGKETQTARKRWIHTVLEVMIETMLVKMTLKGSLKASGHNILPMTDNYDV